MIRSVHPALWFEAEAEAAAERYLAAFQDGRVVSRQPVAVSLELLGHRLLLINGGPMVRPTPALSLFVTLDREGAVMGAWDALSEGGEVLMPLEPTPWSPMFGWVQDRWGVSWQLNLRTEGSPEQALAPALMFTGAQLGRAEEALDLYTRLLPGGAVHGVTRTPAGHVGFALAEAAGQQLILMDSAHPHGFTFTEGVSMVVECETQDDIDHAWDGLVEGGEASRCGWLKDRFGVSWQVVPASLSALMSDPERAQRVVEAFLPMQKLDLATLERAAEG